MLLGLILLFHCVPGMKMHLVSQSWWNLPLESRACTFLWGRSKKIKPGRLYIQRVCLQSPGNGGVQMRSLCPCPDGKSPLVGEVEDFILKQ